MTHEEILHQIPDYVLGLSSPKQSGAIEQHISHCATCYHAVLQERSFGRLVRSTVDAATTPNYGRIRSLMPPVPQKRRAVPVIAGWQKKVAPALLLMLLVIAGLTLNTMLPAGTVPSLVATAHAATATSTYAPTATMAQSLPENEELDYSPDMTYSNTIDTALLVPAPSADRPVETPDPLPTPVAAIRQVTAQ